MIKRSYDFWAVGLNCCSGVASDFRCGEFNNLHARSSDWPRLVYDVDIQGNFLHRFARNTVHFSEMSGTMTAFCIPSHLLPLRVFHIQCNYWIQNVSNVAAAVGTNKRRQERTPISLTGQRMRKEGSATEHPQRLSAIQRGSTSFESRVHIPANDAIRR